MSCSVYKLGKISQRGGGSEFGNVGLSSSAGVKHLHCTSLAFPLIIIINSIITVFLFYIIKLCLFQSTSSALILLPISLCWMRERRDEQAAVQCLISSWA